MLNEIIPFPIDLIDISGITLWALALYLGLSGLSQWVIYQLNRWFNYAEKSLYTSQEEYDRTKLARESVNELYASVFSIVPFLLIGILFNYGIEYSLGRSWSITLGIIASICCGVYELGKRSTNN